MITGFEEYTERLTEDEKRLAEKMAAGFLNHRGKEQAISNRQVVEAMQKRGERLKEAKVRKMINYIRLAGLAPRLLANSDGYYVSDDIEEVQVYLASLQDRLDAIRAVRDALTKQLHELKNSKR